MRPGLRRLVDEALAVPLPPVPPPWPEPDQSHEEWALTVSSLREAHERAGAERAAQAAAEIPAPPAPAEVSAEDVTVPVDGGSIIARVYRPDTTPPCPALVVFHGGGFWIGGGKLGMEAADGPCRVMSAALGSVVVNVDYRVAPEHRFPGPLLDCYAATAWVADNSAQLGIDRDRISVTGASAGANLAIGVTLVARDRGGPPLRSQLLLVPAVDPGMSFPSIIENAADTEVDERLLQATWDYYFGPDADRTHPHAAVLNADLRGLPPAHIVVAEFDPLRDEGIALAQRLRDAGVPTTLARHPMTHYFAEPDVAVAYVADAIAAVDRANRG